MNNPRSLPFAAALPVLAAALFAVSTDARAGEPAAAPAVGALTLEVSPIARMFRLLEVPVPAISGDGDSRELLSDSFTRHDPVREPAAFRERTPTKPPPESATAAPAPRAFADPAVSLFDWSAPVVAPALDSAAHRAFAADLLAVPARAVLSADLRAAWLEEAVLAPIPRSLAAPVPTLSLPADSITAASLSPVWNPAPGSRSLATPSPGSAHTVTTTTDGSARPAAGGLHAQRGSPRLGQQPVRPDRRWHERHGEQPRLAHNRAQPDQRHHESGGGQPPQPGADEWRQRVRLRLQLLRPVGHQH